LTNTSVTCVAAPALTAWVQAAFEQQGVAATDAAIFADHLVQANLRGVDSHGVSRLPIYLKRFAAGVVAKETRTTIEQEAAAFALLDGGNGSGPVVGIRAMQLAVDKARQAGVGVVGVKNSNHCGFLAYYTAMAAEQGLIGIAATSAPSNIAPWGGKVKYFGANPFCLAVPAGEERPVILDMSSSQVAKGKIMLAAKEGKPSIPAGWALDPEGRPTTDPKVALTGTLFPLGGPKGYGLALMVDVLCGMLTGAAFGPYLGDLYQEFSRNQNVGHFFMALRPDLFVSAPEFRSRMDQMIREVRSQPKADGVARIYMPGEIEDGVRAERTANGIPLTPEVYKELVALGQTYALPFPNPID